MTDHSTTSAAVANAARRRAATEALDAAVVEWLYAHRMIPEGRDVAVDYAIPFMARWLTTGGNVGRKGGCVVPPCQGDVISLSELMQRQSWRIRSAAEWDMRDRGANEQAVNCLPDCQTPHEIDPPGGRHCSASLGLFSDNRCSGSPGRLSIELYTHEVHQGGQAPRSWIEVRQVDCSSWDHRRDAVTELGPREAYSLGSKLLDAVERLNWRESAR